MVRAAPIAADGLGVARVAPAADGQLALGAATAATGVAAMWQTRRLLGGHPDQSPFGGLGGHTETPFIHVGPVGPNNTGHDNPPLPPELTGAGPIGGGFRPTPSVPCHTGHPPTPVLSGSEKETFPIQDPKPTIISTPATAPQGPITLETKAAEALPELKRRGFTGITQDSNNGLDYANSNALFPSGVRTKLSDGTPTSSIVRIKYSGSYKRDFEAASMAGFGQKSDPTLNGQEYIWRHLNDYDPATNEGTMQLVRKDAHLGIQHIGGCAQYKSATGNPCTWP